MPRRKELTTQKIPKLLMKQSVPAAIGMLVMTLYNVVDSIFIGKGVGTLGLAGVALSFPISMIIGATAQTFGVGFSSLISRSMGAKDYARTRKAFGNYICLSVLTGLLITLLGRIFLHPLIRGLGASETIYPYVQQYIEIIILGSVFFIILQGSNGILRSIGEAKKAMNTMILAAVLNIVLDAIFIFGFDMGIAGAAWATIISWLVGGLYVFNSLLGKKGNLQISKSDLIPKKDIIKEGLSVGASSFARQASSSLMIMILNRSLIVYANDIAIAAFGIVVRILMLVLMPVMGIVQGMIPIIGTNHGAKKDYRVKEVTSLAIKTATIFSIISFAIIMLFATQLISIFTSDLSLIESSKNLLMITALGLPFVGFQTVVGGFYQALGAAKLAFLVSMTRQVLLFIPLILILPLFFGATGIYASFPVSDIGATIITYFIFSKDYKALK